MNIKQTVLAMATVFAFPMVAQAQDATVETVAAPAEVKVDPIASPQLLASFEAICDSDAKLSEKATTACTTAQPPKAAKSGLIFRNTGIGAEFNTLIRNVTAFNTIPVDQATVISE